MSLKTIFRVEKIKDDASLAKANGHALRTIHTPNANELETIHNEHLYGVKDLVKAKNELFAKRLKKKPRKGAVICMDGLLTLSPEFFETEKDGHDFKKAALKYLKQNFGEELLAVHYHVDEKSPHIHFYVVPLTEDNRLTAFECFGKTALENFQESYCMFMSEVLNKTFTYQKGSKAKHKTVKKFYTELNETEKEFNEIKKENKELSNALVNQEEQNFKLECKIEDLQEELKETKKEVNKLKLIIRDLKEKLNKFKTAIINFKKKNKEKPKLELTPEDYPDPEIVLNHTIKNRNKNKPRL